jgi:ATP-dependent DNA helicase RecG
VFGVTASGAVSGIDQPSVERLAHTLANLGHDAIESPIAIDHALVSFREAYLLLVYIAEQPVKPIHIREKTIEQTSIRSGGTSRKASRQEAG